MIRGLVVQGKSCDIKYRLNRFRGLTVVQAIKKLEVEWIINNKLG